MLGVRLGLQYKYVEGKKVDIQEREYECEIS